MRFGLIGTGFWASEVHAPGIVAGVGAELAGVWGRSEDTADALARRFGVRAYRTPAELFAHVDAVSFAVPPDVQAPLAVEAAQAGCHLLLEKPLALGVEPAKNVLAAIESSGVSSIVFLTSRFVPEVARWLDAARSAGGWAGASATWIGSAFQPGSPFGESAWRRRWGALWDVGPHALSVVLPVLGPVAAVTAVRGPGDTVHVVLRHEGGASSTLLLSLTVPQRAAKQSFELYGEQGGSQMPAPAVNTVELLATAAEALERSAATGAPHECDATFGRQIVDVLAQAQAHVS